MAHAGSRAQEGLGGAEVQIHVEPNGEVVGVVGDVEANDFLFFIVLAFHEREHQTTISNVGVFHFERLLSAEHNALASAIASVGHDEIAALPHVPACRVERTGAQHHRNHVVNALIALQSLRMFRTAIGRIAHLHPAFPFRVAIADGIHAEVLAFVCPLRVVERGDVHIGETRQGVAHHE